MNVWAAIAPQRKTSTSSVTWKGASAGHAAYRLHARFLACIVCVRRYFGKIVIAE
jgi:hypothetical protein